VPVSQGTGVPSVSSTVSVARRGCWFMAEGAVRWPPAPASSEPDHPAEDVAPQSHSRTPPSEPPRPAAARRAQTRGNGRYRHAPSGAMVPSAAAARRPVSQVDPGSPRWSSPNGAARSLPARSRGAERTRPPHGRIGLHINRGRSRASHPNAFPVPSIPGLPGKDGEDRRRGVGLGTVPSSRSGDASPHRIPTGRGGPVVQWSSQPDLFRDFDRNRPWQTLSS
jgi:hypothetical protein